MIDCQPWLDHRVEETSDISKLDIDELIVLSCQLWAIDCLKLWRYLLLETTNYVIKLDIDQLIGFLVATRIDLLTVEGSQSEGDE